MVAPSPGMFWQVLDGATHTWLAAGQRYVKLQPPVPLGVPVKHGLANAAQSSCAEEELVSRLLLLVRALLLLLLSTLEEAPEETPARLVEPPAVDVPAVDVPLLAGLLVLLAGPPDTVLVLLPPAVLVPGPTSLTALELPGRELERGPLLTVKENPVDVPPPDVPVFPLLAALELGRHRSPWHCSPVGHVTLPPQVNRQMPPTQRCPWTHSSPPQLSAGGVEQAARAAHSAAAAS